MALAYDLDRDISLETETKHQSLYKWCLNERKKDGNQLGRNLIPFKWSILFHSISFGIEHCLTSERRSSFLKEQNNDPLIFSETDHIFANLAVGSYDGERWSAPSISMMGTSRAIDEIALRIVPVDEAGEEYCQLWGTVAYDSEIDFRNERISDTIVITFGLERGKFYNLFNLVKSSEIDRLSLWLSNVEGFYSEWSPSISTSQIKVLTNAEDQGLAVDDDWSKIIPTLGRVGEAQITAQRTRAANLPEFGDREGTDESHQDISSSSPFNDSTTAPTSGINRFYERSLSRISKLLGLLIVIEILKAIFH